MTVEQTERSKYSHILWCHLVGILFVDLTIVQPATEQLMHGRLVLGLEYQDAWHESEDKGVNSFYALTHFLTHSKSTQLRLHQQKPLNDGVGGVCIHQSHLPYAIVNLKHNHSE